MSSPRAAGAVRPSWRYPAERRIFRALAWIFLRSRGRLEVRGEVNIPVTGPAIVVANHIATMDPPLVGTLVPRHDVHYMAKSEAFESPIGRYLLVGFNAFPVVRNSADRRAIATALTVLERGGVVVMFPEGSRSEDGRLSRAFPGVGLLARRSRAPVVCAAVSGSETVLPKGARWPRGGRITVRFGEPFVIPERDADSRTLDSEAATDMIMTRLAALLPERYRGVYGDGASEGAPPAA